MGENFCKYIYDKALTSRIYKELLQLNSKRTAQLKWVKNLFKYDLKFFNYNTFIPGIQWSD